MVLIVVPLTSVFASGQGDQPASGQLQNPLTTKGKRDALSQSVITMHRYLNQFFTNEKMAEIAAHKAEVHNNFQVENLSDSDSEVNAPSLAGVYIASALMTLCSENNSSLTAAECAIGNALLQIPDYSGITDELTLRMPRPPDVLPDNVRPELGGVVTAVRWYHAMLRLASIDSDAGLRNLALAQRYQAPQAIRGTQFFISMHSGRVLRKQSSRQIPVNVLVVRHTDGKFVSVERFYDLNFDQPGFPERLPGWAEADVQPTRYRVLSFVDGDPQVDIYEQPRDKTTVAQGDRIEWSQVTGSPAEGDVMVQKLIEAVGTVTAPEKVVLLDSRAALEHAPTEQPTEASIKAPTAARVEARTTPSPNAQATGVSVSSATSPPLATSPNLTARSPDPIPLPHNFAAADEAFAQQLLSLFELHMRSLSDASTRYKILDTMSERLQISAGHTGTPNAALSMPDMQRPLDCKLTVYRTPAMNALWRLTDKAASKYSQTALEVLWAVTAQSNAALVEYAIAHPEFVATMTPLRTQIYASAKQFRDSGQAQNFQKIWSDPAFVRSTQTYTRSWFDYWFAGTWQLYVYLADRTTVADLKALIGVAGRHADTQPAIPLLAQLARNLALFTGQTGQVADIMPDDFYRPSLGLRPSANDFESNLAIEGRLESGISSLNEAPAGYSFRPDMRFRLQLWEIAKVERQHKAASATSPENQEILRRYFVVDDLLNYSLTTPNNLKPKFVSGNWDGLDLRRALPLLDEIANGHLKTERDRYSLSLGPENGSELSRLFPWLWNTSHASDAGSQPQESKQ